MGDFRPKPSSKLLNLHESCASLGSANDFNYLAPAKSHAGPAYGKSTAYMPPSEQWITGSADGEPAKVYSVAIDRADDELKALQGHAFGIAEQENR